MIQSNKDLYRTVNKIINELKQVQQFGYAKQLEDALSISAIPGEILGETRMALKKLECFKLVDKLGIKLNSEEALNYLNTIL